MTTDRFEMNTAAVTIRVEVSGNARDLSDDAYRAAEAVAAWLDANPISGDLAAMREEYRAAAEGEIDVAAEATAYGRLYQAACEVAENAANEGWANPGAICNVDISPR